MASLKRKNVDTNAAQKRTKGKVWDVVNPSFVAELRFDQGMQDEGEDDQRFDPGVFYVRFYHINSQWYAHHLDIKRLVDAGHLPAFTKPVENSLHVFQSFANRKLFATRLIPCNSLPHDFCRLVSEMKEE